MQSDAGNQGSGAAMAFMGMNMDGVAAVSTPRSLYQMGQAPVAAQPAAGADGGGPACCARTATATSARSAAPRSPWRRLVRPKCGAVNKGKFCAECGAKKPADAPLYKCRQMRLGAGGSGTFPPVLPTVRRPFTGDDIVK
jgi:membrane protease subunit (stomatin/prohibitin family)